MNTLRMTAFGLVCTLTLGAVPAMADRDDECQWMTHHYGYMGTMGQGGPWVPVPDG